jgi:hypothetical protein
VDPLKTTWLGELSGTAVVQEKLDKRHQTKEALLAKMQKQLQVDGKELFDSMNLNVVNEEGRKQRVLNYGVRDQLTEFDLDEQQDGYTLESDEDLARHLKAQRMVTLMANDLEQEVEKLDENGDPMVDEHGNPVMEPLFSEEELKDVLYQPLVRQGLLAETFVPDDFSLTREMLDGTFDAYSDRLKSEPLKSTWAENKSLVLTCIKSTGTIVNSSVALDGLGKMTPADFEPKWGVNTGEFAEKLRAGDPATLVEVTTKGIEHLLTIGDDAYSDIVDGVSESRDRTSEKREMPLRRKKAGGLASQFIMNVSAALGGEIATIHDATGRAISSSYATLTKANDVARHIAAEELSTTECGEIATALAAGLENAMKKSAPSGVDPKPMVDAGQAMQRELIASIDKVKLAELLEDENFSKAVDLVARAAAVAIQKGISQDLIDMLEDAGNQQKIADAVNKQITEDFLEADEEMKKRKKKEAQELERLAKANDAQAFAGLLEKKINALVRKQELIKWAANISSLGFDAASKVLAPLAIAGGAVKIAQNVYEATMRFIDLHNFMDHYKDMVKAASAFSAAVDQFCSNSARQAAHYTAVAALELVKMIGAIVECTGFGAAAGKAVQAIADIGSALEAVIYEIAKRYDLEVAWGSYKMALLRPDNRKLGLMAIKKNATLAKYAVAWGAVIKKDPLVKDFMHSCQLNENTLKDPQANVDKVVKYLELRMPDDNVVVGRQVIAIDWAPKPIELTVTCWAGAKSRAEAKTKMVPFATRTLDANLTDYNSNLETLKNTVTDKDNMTPQDFKKDMEDGLKTSNDLLNSIEGGFNGISPKRTSAGKTIIHSQMNDVISEFVNCVGDGRKSMTELAKTVP